jgi:hypothetical protein
MGPGSVANSTRRANQQFPSSHRIKNIPFFRIPNPWHDSAVSRPLRDVSRSSRYVGQRCDGTLWRQRDFGRADENAAAYGEIVWSWRRDPGATLAGSIPPATGARKAASPGRARISRKTIARGKPGCPGCTCSLTRVHFCSTLRTRDCGAQSAPGFPCALCGSEGQSD